MLKKTSELQVGDVITSPEFQFGEQDSRFDKDLPVVVGFAEAPRGFANASDPSRVSAKFLVIHTMIEGDVVIQQSANDYWSRIYAKRLNDDGSFNPTGEVVTFGDGTNCPGIDEVTLVGSMVMNFMPVRE